MRLCVRAFLISLAALLLSASSANAQPTPRLAPLTVGLTPVFLDDQDEFLRQWRVYLESRLGREVRFVQRGSYRETVEMLRDEKIDFAWICGYPYVRYQTSLRLLAVPLYRGKPLYQSYLIVPATDRTSQSIHDLRGKVFAYSDPDSNSGYLYPTFLLREAGEQPQDFFSRSFFTWAHRKVVASVASGLAQAGAVDGYVWETLKLLHPDLVGRTRVISRSPEFGHPPFAARPSIGEADFRSMQRVLLGMSAETEGARLLKTLNLDGFVAGTPGLFDGIAHMMNVAEKR